MGKISVTPYRAKFVAYMATRKTRTITVSQLGKVLNCDNKRASALLLHWSISKLVKRIKQGVYEVRPEGEKFINESLPDTKNDRMKRIPRKRREAIANAQKYLNAITKVLKANKGVLTPKMKSELIKAYRVDGSMFTYAVRIGYFNQEEGLYFPNQDFITLDMVKKIYERKDELTFSLIAKPNLSEKITPKNVAPVKNDVGLKDYMVLMSGMIIAGFDKEDEATNKAEELAKENNVPVYVLTIFEAQQVKVKVSTEIKKLF